MKNGTLYGVGVGPGDPELLTLKAVRILKEADVIAVPGEKKEETTAYRIASQAVPEIAQKECLAVVMPMTKLDAKLDESHAQAASQVEKALRAGKNVAFLTLGDPTVYSTYMYVHRRITRLGYETGIVSGIPSFCAAAASFGLPLAERDEPIHIVPASGRIGDALRLPGTKVLMKAGKNIKAIKEMLLSEKAEVFAAENCGMPDERRFCSAQEIPEDAGYYTLMIVKEN